MEIKITVNVSDIDPIEIKVGVPVEGVEKVEAIRPNAGIDSAWFNEDSTGWTKNPERNKIFLIMQQEYCNEKLRRNGFIVENEVRDILGLPRTKRGQVVGWIWDNDDPDKQDVVDFGIFADYNCGFINGTENRALLNFNVRGDVLTYL